MMGDITVTVCPPRGMISLKADLAGTAAGYAVKKATGLALPPQRQVTASPTAAVLWMAPDELLLVGPRSDVGQTQDALSSAFGDGHFLAADVSGARVAFALEGPDARVREVLARLTPADMHPESFGPGHVRRTRLAQVAAAIWMKDGAAEVFVFRSVADYAEGLLQTAAGGTPVDHF